MRSRNIIPAFLAVLLISATFVISVYSADPPDYEWPAQTFDKASSDEGSCVIQTRADGYIIAAGTNYYDGGVYLIKTDDNGTEDWHKIYSNSNAAARCIKQTEDGGYIVTGNTGGLDALLIKTDAYGEKDNGKGWYNTYIGTADRGNCVVEVSDGYVVAGEKSGDTDGVIIFKTDTSGTILEGWPRAYEGNGATWINPTTDGGFIVS